LAIYNSLIHVVVYSVMNFHIIYRFYRILSTSAFNIILNILLIAIRAKSMFDVMFKQFSFLNIQAIFIFDSYLLLQRFLSLSNTGWLLLLFLLLSLFFVVIRFEIRTGIGSWTSVTRVLETKDKTYQSFFHNTAGRCLFEANKPF